ncbi:SHOCT domain-containing protein [Rhodococcus sp. MTM3W5.2]|uniref:SHOCT domain-containing protein n=1 Tax=Rhodococcus sp. MTM3W5.2 TaxID=1805827 RepID=UPI00097CAB7F|nr:SHOCT domain-containing protein [Rhodococcus sp. MTM3W5.2]
MVFRAGRRGRPGLLGTVARTAVIAGTAQATSNAMNRRSQQKAAEQQAYVDQQAAQQQAAYAQQAQAQQVPAPQAAPAGDDLITKLQQLAQLHQSGALSDEEFAAAKAQLLG